MTVIWIAVAAIGFLVALEITLWWLVGVLRPSFQWLIGPQDEAPNIDQDLVARHIQQAFDAEVGWIGKPHRHFGDDTADGPVEYHIGALGARTNPGFDDRPSDVAVFGDSYAFCRLVNDDETWPHILSQRLNTNTLNFGVGNYGLDQAVLRLRRELPRIASRFIVIAVVPETIVRIHSYWKHYFEYGNVLAFKPRFVLEKGRLVCYPPAIRNQDDFRNYRDKLDLVKKLDPFYRRKFANDLLRFPYLWHVLMRAPRHVPILWLLVVGILTRNRDTYRRKAFDIVVRENASFTATMYGEEKARGLLEALAKYYQEICCDTGRLAMLVVIPQPVDLVRYDQGHDDYGDFFRNLQAVLPVCDLTKIFLEYPEREKLFVEGRLGPHTSVKANALIADQLASYISGAQRPKVGASGGAASPAAES